MIKTNYYKKHQNIGKGDIENTEGTPHRLSDEFKFM